MSSKNSNLRQKQKPGSFSQTRVRLAAQFAEPALVFPNPGSTHCTIRRTRVKI